MESLCKEIVETFKIDKELVELLPAIESYSNCLHRKVGSLIYDINKKEILSVGANVTPAPSPCTAANCCTKHTTGLCAVIHSEVWTLTNLFSSTWKNPNKAHLVMLATYSPCYECSKMLQRFGVKHVAYLYKHHRTVWEYLKECGIDTYQIPEEITKLSYEEPYEELVTKHRDFIEGLYRDVEWRIDSEA